MEADEPVNAAYINSGKFEIDLAGTLYAAKAYLKSPYDSENKRPKVNG